MLCYEKIPSEHTAYIFILLVRALLITSQILKHNMMFSAVLWWHNDEGWYVTSLHPSNDSWGGLPEYPQRDCSCNSEQFLGVSMSCLTGRNSCSELTEGDWLVNGWSRMRGAPSFLRYAGEMPNPLTFETALESTKIHLWRPHNSIINNKIS